MIEQEGRRITLDEKLMELEVERAAMDREERRQAVEERSGMVEMLSALVKKLQ